MEMKSVLYFSPLLESFQEDIVHVHNNISIKWEKNDKEILKTHYLMAIQRNQCCVIKLLGCHTKTFANE